MTFREKLKLEHPELLDKLDEPHQFGTLCPFKFGYEGEYDGLCALMWGGSNLCPDCWDREIPEDKSMTHVRKYCCYCRFRFRNPDRFPCSECEQGSRWQEEPVNHVDAEAVCKKLKTQVEQELHDREINEEILRGYCANYDSCSDGCPIFQDEDLRKLVCSGRGARGHFYFDAQLAALDAFKSVLPAEDVTADQCGTCRFGENDCEDWPCNECVDYDEWMPRFSVSVTTQESGTMPEEPQNPDAWEDTSFGGYRHKKIAEELTALYARKNADYGDSFHRSFVDWGMPMAAIRLGDKYNRFVSLVKNKGDTKVKDESLRDTLIDLANYAIMTVMELDEESKGAF